MTDVMDPPTMHDTIPIPRERPEESQAPEEIDPEAPYGRRPDGTAYKRSPEWRERVGQVLAAGRAAKRAGTGAGETRRGPGRPRKATGSPSSPRPGAPRKEAVDYRPGVAGLLQLPTVMLAMLGRVNPAYSLDALTLNLHTPAIAEAVHQTAINDDRVAAILDKVLAAGPYGALLGALIPVGLQIAANHGKLAPSPEMGILSQDELLAATAAK